MYYFDKLLNYMKKIFPDLKNCKNLECQHLIKITSNYLEYAMHHSK